MVPLSPSSGQERSEQLDPPLVCPVRLPVSIAQVILLILLGDLKVAAFAFQHLIS